MSVQLQALADEVVEAAAALDLVVPSGPHTVAGLTDETQVAMVQVFPQIPSPRGGPCTQFPSPSGGGQGGGFTAMSVQDEATWGAFDGLIRADAAEQGLPDAITAQLIALHRWRAANASHRFYLAHDGNRALARIGLFQHRTTAYLHGLFTHPDFRRCGAGSFLTLAMDAEARLLGCERVVLRCTRESRLPAYFERLGFRAVGEQQTWTNPE